MYKDVICHMSMRVYSCVYMNILSSESVEIMNMNYMCLDRHNMCDAF